MSAQPQPQNAKMRRSYLKMGVIHVRGKATFTLKLLSFKFKLDMQCILFKPVSLKGIKPRFLENI